MPLEGEVWELTELDGYETPIKDGHLNDVVSGDLNNDGRKDLVFLETAQELSRPRHLRCQPQTDSRQSLAGI